MPTVRHDDPDHDFTLDHYREIISSAAKSHRMLSFADAADLGRDILDIDRFLIMRHDVEFSLPAAVRLAEIDAELGVRSTFFLLQTSDYNPFEEEDALRVRRILELGHDLGLHYDGGLFERLGVDAGAVARKQIELFEAFFDTRIKAMSSHMPMRSGVTLAIDGVVDAYDPLYLVDMKYLSDSVQAWREGVVTKVLDRYPHIHLLTHEFIWHPEGLDWDTLLLIEAHEKFQGAWQRALVNIDGYRNGLRMRAKKDQEFLKRYMRDA